MTDLQDLQLLIAIIVFAVGSFGAAVLGFVAWQLSRRPSTATVYQDTIYLCITCGLAVLLEVSTLIWDSMFPTHFPLLVRVPVLLLLVPTMTGTALRLLYHFVGDAHQRKIQEAEVRVTATAAH